MNAVQPSETVELPRQFSQALRAAGLTVTRFAAATGFNPLTVRRWAQTDRIPAGIRQELRWALIEFMLTGSLDDLRGLKFADQGHGRSLSLFDQNARKTGVLIPG